MIIRNFGANGISGLGKAVVLEGVNRCGKLGAKHAYVLSSQQFYYNIGFYPYQNDIWWIHKKRG
jgi:predicted N-acetyltransferase YhbS